MSDFQGPMSLVERDRPELMAMLNLIFRPNGGDMAHDYARHLGPNNLENIRVIKQNGRIVSHVATSIRPVVLGGIATQVAGIGAVASLPEARGKGFASLLMQDAVGRSREQGADIMLISGDRDLYRRLCAVDCGRFPIVRLTASDMKPVSSFSLARAGHDDIDDIIALRQTLPTRYLLPREDLAALLDHKMVMDKPTDWWMIRRDSETVGWGVLYVQPPDLHLFDWAGNPEALAGAVPLWLNAYNAETITLTVTDRYCLPLAWNSFIERERAFDGTVLILDARRLFERATPYLIERIGEENFQRLRIETDQQRLRVALDSQKIDLSDGGEIAQFFFGAPQRDFLAECIAPDSELCFLLSRAFPIPLVWYGIGYV